MHVQAIERTPLHTQSNGSVLTRLRNWSINPLKRPFEELSGATGARR